MGLLDKAERLRERSGGSPRGSSATTASPSSAATITSPRGLRARAEAFRQAGVSGRAAGSSTGGQQMGAALGSQAQRLGRGLLARAEAMRAKSGSGSATPTPPRVAPLGEAESASLGAAVGKGLLARAEEMRARREREPSGPQGDAPRPEPEVATPAAQDPGDRPTGLLARAEELAAAQPGAPETTGTSGADASPADLAGPGESPADGPLEPADALPEAADDLAASPGLEVEDIESLSDLEVESGLEPVAEEDFELVGPDDFEPGTGEGPSDFGEFSADDTDGTDDFLAPEPADAEGAARRSTPDDDFDDGFPDLSDVDTTAEAGESEDQVVLGDDTDTEDPFSQWQQEAESAAAEVAAAELRAGPEPEDEDDEPEPDTHLFADDEFSTRPVELHIAGQKKIDNYLALFDITKELAQSDSVAALWETILYGVMGQVGAETICIFSSMRERNGRKLFPVSHSGFELSESWSLEPGDLIYERCSKEEGVRYADEFLEADAGALTDTERSILETTGAKLIVPLKNMGHTYGVIFLGAQLSGDDYTIDDMEFLTLLGETAAVGVDRAMARRDYEKSTEDLRRKTEQQSRIFDVAREVSGVKNLDELYDLTAQHLKADFGVESFSIILLNPRLQEYRLFGGNQISPASIARFRLPVNSELVGLISNLIRVYELPDFRENRELSSCYTNDDLALMDSYWVVPLISLNWLVGFLTIHRTTREWTELDRELIVSAAEMLAPVYANAVILGERETLFRDPFSPLEGRLKLEIKKAREFQAAVSLVELRVKNIKRLMAANPQEEVAEFLAEFGRAVGGFLFESDFLARVGQGRFALVLPGRSSGEAEIFVKKLKAEFKRRRFLPGSPVDVQYSTAIASFPVDADDAGKMLAMLD